MSDNSWDSYRVGQQWGNIVNRLTLETIELKDFKRSPPTMLFATFAPEKFGLAYLRTLIYHLYVQLPQEARDMIRKTRNRDIGSPHVIHIDGQKVDLDYIQSAQEAVFIKPALEKVTRVVEIGAGYGRTCHLLLENFLHLAEYVIIDLPFTMGLSRSYLREALTPELYQKIRFLEVGNVNEPLSLEKVGDQNLFINIDSMAEMDRTVACNYLRLIDECGIYFFCKNTVGKYAPVDMGETRVGQKDLHDALGSGLMPGTIDVFDADLIDSFREKYNQVYSPGPGWSVLSEADSDCYLHYRRVLYSKGKN